MSLVLLPRRVDSDWITSAQRPLFQFPVNNERR